MTTGNIGIGILFTFIAAHAALLLVSWVAWSNLDLEYNPGDPECANPTYYTVNEQICSVPSWAQTTPLRHVVSALPAGQEFNLQQMITLPGNVVFAIIHMLTLNYAILKDVDPVTEFVLFIINLVSVMTVLLLLFNAGKSFLGGLLGRRSF